MAIIRVDKSIVPARAGAFADEDERAVITEVRDKQLGVAFGFVTLPANTSVALMRTCENDLWVAHLQTFGDVDDVYLQCLDVVAPNLIQERIDFAMEPASYYRGGRPFSTLIWGEGTSLVLQLLNRSSTKRQISVIFTRRGRE